MKLILKTPSYLGDVLFDDKLYIGGQYDAVLGTMDKSNWKGYIKSIRVFYGSGSASISDFYWTSRERYRMHAYN